MRKPRKSKPDATSEAISIGVRMYREILGDCFLIKVRENGRTIHVLVDCGILQGMPDAAERARRIMADVASTTGGVLDVLIVTHEHWDHLSCFSQAEDVFDTIRIKELWLAWTEDERDELARALRVGRRRALAVVRRSNEVALRLAAAQEQADLDEEDEVEATHKPPSSTSLADLLAFFGPEPGLGMVPTTETVLRKVRSRADRIRYFRPGDGPEPVAGLKGFRAFVLGPPRDETLLKRSRPRKSRPEVYELAEPDFDGLFLLAALPSSSDPQTELRDAGRPFAGRWLLDASAPPKDEDETTARDFHAAIYGDPDQAWRRIDEDWLLAGEQIALKLDSDTNNTSLAIAFEFGTGPDARVLLFPGDAQVGNWLSWGDLRWSRPRSEAGEVEEISADDLLARTVLYKVGHHGSHNATMRERGLELMTSRDLVAMVPVHERFANDTKNWNMPFPSLLRRLEEKTAHRVIRADRGKDHLENLAVLHGGREGELTIVEWRRFLDSLREIADEHGALAVELSISTPPA